MYSVKIILPMLLFVYEVQAVRFDFSLVLFEGNKTQGYNYTARRELPKSVVNATRIQLNQKVPILLRGFDLSFATNLQALVMDNCAINDIEVGSFNKLPALENLTITRNNIKLIREGVFNSVKVKHLDLSHNKLATLVVGAFDNMNDLISINLDYNELTSYAISFKNCPNLTSISVQFNFIQYIPDGLFEFLTNRKLNVYFNHNKISKIHSAAFDTNEFDNLYLDHNDLELFDNSLNKVNTLNLNVNNVSCLTEDFVKNDVAKAARILLYENPFNCSCYDDVFKLKNVLVGRPSEC